MRGLFISIFIVFMALRPVPAAEEKWDSISSGNNPLHPLWIMTESVTSNGLISALGQERTTC